MKSDDGRDDAVEAASHADVLAEAKRMEEAGDAARRTGDLFFALLQYRRAAELLPEDEGLAAKVAATAAERARNSESKNGESRSTIGWPAVLAYAATLAAVIAIAAAPRLLFGSKEAAPDVVARRTTENLQPPPAAPVEPPTLPLPAAAVPATAPSVPAPSAIHEASGGPSPSELTHAEREVRRHPARHPQTKLVASRLAVSRARFERAAPAACRTEVQPCRCESASYPRGPRPMGLLQLIFG